MKIDAGASTALTISRAADAAARDLLDAERSLRALAEEENRDLRAALQLAAYTFAGAAYEAEIRKDQRILDHWTPQDWMDFFQSVAPISQGWSDPTTLAERLAEVVRERDAALIEVRRLRDEVQGLRSELATRILPPKKKPELAPPPQAPAQDQRQADGVKRHTRKSSLPASKPPQNSSKTRSQGPAPPSAQPIKIGGYPGFTWPDIPDRPPSAYSRYFDNKKWQREGLALALVARGLSMRLELAELIGLRAGIDPRSGSIRRMFDRLVKRKVLEKELFRVGSVNVMMIRITERGQKAARSCQFPVVEGELDRMLRLHGGNRQRGHAAATVVFAYQARRRGWQVEVMPEVEPPAEPDVLIANDSGAMYVEVELGEEKYPKWRNMFDLQHHVALCALTVEGRAKLVKEVQDLSIPGRATDIHTLIKEKDEGRLWVDVWG